MTASSPAVTSSPDFLLDLAYLMSHLAGPIVDSRDDGGGYGGAAGLDYGGGAPASLRTMLALTECCQRAREEAGGCWGDDGVLRW